MAQNFPEKAHLNTDHEKFAKSHERIFSKPLPSGLFHAAAAPVEIDFEMKCCELQNELACNYVISEARLEEILHDFRDGLSSIEEIKAELR